MLWEHSLLQDRQNGQPLRKSQNVPIVLILPCRWQDGAESLGIERPQNLSMTKYTDRYEVVIVQNILDEVFGIKDGTSGSLPDIQDCLVTIGDK